MLLPIRTAPGDIEAICGCLLRKPAGLSASEMINQKLDGRKVSALKFWGLIEDAARKLILSPRGRLVAADGGRQKARALHEVLLATPPYGSAISWAIERSEAIMMASDVAAHWQLDFPAYLHFHAGVLNQQIVCFLRIAEAAALGRLVVGRKGNETRFELCEADARKFLADAGAEWRVDAGAGSNHGVASGDAGLQTTARRRVFIALRGDGKLQEQVKELVAFGNFEPVVAREQEVADLPLYDLMHEMRACDTALIHVTAADILRDPALISGDALLEIGAAMAIYGCEFVVLVENGVALPANLHGPRECRYTGQELDMPAMMRLLRAFSCFALRRGAKLAVSSSGRGTADRSQVAHFPPQGAQY
jgi:hypothetical protein